MKRFPEGLRKHFRPQRVLGEGASGVVYLCAAGTQDRLVALKLLPIQRKASDAARFEQEARILRAFRHPNIARLYDWGRFEQLYWLAMEYLQGETLRERLTRKGRYSSGRRVLMLVRQVSKALGYAHSRGVLHRDIKPENLFLIGEDRVKLLDFGLAKVENQTGPALTRPGMLLGTPAYMAPERARGEGAQVASDVYSLAMVTYEMLAGEPAFRGAPMDVLQAQLREEPRPLPSFIPPEISRAVLRGLDKDPGARPVSARALLEELREAVREVIEKQRRGETPKESAAVSDFQEDDLASQGELDIMVRSRPEDRPVLPGRGGREGPNREPAPGSGAEAGSRPRKGAARATEVVDRGSPTLGREPGPGLARETEVVSREGGLSRHARTPRRGTAAPGFRGRMQRLSRALQVQGLLSKRARATVLGLTGCLLTGLLFLWGSGSRPTPPPEVVERVIGSHGIEVRWSHPEPASYLVVCIPEGEVVSGPWPDAAMPEPGLQGVVRLEGLLPGTPYRLWYVGEDRTPRELSRFRTAEGFEIEEVRFRGGEGEPYRLRIEASLPWSGGFGTGASRVETEGGLEVAHELPLPRRVRGPLNLWVSTPGVSTPLLARGFSEPLARALERQLGRIDSQELTRRIFELFPGDKLEAGPLGLEEDADRVRPLLSEYRALELVLQNRYVLSALLEDPELPPQRRLELIQAMIPLVQLDATLEALRLRTHIWEREVELGEGIRNFFRVRFQRENLPSPQDPGPSSRALHLWPVEANEIHPLDMDGRLLEQYVGARRALKMDEDSFQSRLAAELDLPRVPQGEGELGLLVRVCHPETVLVVELNERAWVPLRFPREAGAIRYGTEKDPLEVKNLLGVGEASGGDPARGPAERMLEAADRIAPVVLVRARLPSGVLREGVNRVRVWALNGRPRPDRYLPVIRGVYLQPAEELGVGGS